MSSSVCTWFLFWSARTDTTGLKLTTATPPSIVESPGPEHMSVDPAMQAMLIRRRRAIVLIQRAAVHRMKMRTHASLVIQRTTRRYLGQRLRRLMRIMQVLRTATPSSHAHHAYIVAEDDSPLPNACAPSSET